MIISRILKESILILFVTGLMIMPALAKNKDNNPASTKGLRKTATNDVYHPMLINNIFNYYSNNGDGSFNNFTSSSEGFEFPKGDNLATVIFEDGVVWGCKQNGSLKVGGSTYWHGLQAGPIITNGTATTLPVADDPGSSANRLYRVRRDLPPIPGVTNPDDPAASAELANVQNSEVALIGRYEVGIKAEAILAQYWADWNQWPASQGAPFNDVNGDGVYDPTVDIPGVPLADQTMWYVANDLDAVRVNTLSGSLPIGIEMQKTIWAYNLNGALANTIFASTKIINKSGKELDSMYVAQWSDPDNGNANDDFVGCDTTRSLGYVYNGAAEDVNFQNYGLKPPAVGFDFFQGPMVAGAATDTAIFDLKYRAGYKNLPMTSFNFFINGNDTYADPANASYSGTISWYNLLKGLVGKTGAQYINPITHAATTFVLSGDPVLSTGWTEVTGAIAPPGDRRMALCSGPFTMMPGDTQEVVVGSIAGRGADYLSSITELKAEDDFDQSIYNKLFSFPQPPSPPKLKVVALDGKVVLSWGDPTAVAKTEGQLNDQGYTFEGYNIWQCPKNGPDGAKLLATYDRSDDTVKIIWDYVNNTALGAKIYQPVRFGTNSGLVHTFEVDKDAITGASFFNDRNYYFAVTAYNYNPSPTLLGTSLENPVNPVTVVPQAALPGINYTQKYGDALAVTHSSGVSGGNVLATVIDANALTGNTYNVKFDSLGLWYLVNVTHNDTVVRKATQTNVGLTPNGYVVDGLQVTTFGPPPGLKPGVQGSAISSSPDIGFEIVSGKRAFTWGGSGAPFGLEGFGGGIGGGYNWGDIFGGAASTIPSNALKDVIVELAATDSIGNPLNLSSDTVSQAYRYLRAATAAPAQPSFAPFIVNATAGYAYQDRRPIAMRAYEWDNTTGTKGKRLDIGFLENNIATGTVDGIYWPPLSTAPTSYAAATNPREWLYIFGTTYSATVANAALTVDILNVATLPLMYWWTAVRNGNSWAGDAYILHPYHVNLASDVFSFTSVAPVADLSQAKTDVAKINVFPNPYLGYNKLELSGYSRFVTFTHLPNVATIRIYNLAGILVRTILKSDNSQFKTWDLQNESGFPVASGMYIAFIDMPNIGMTKTLKLGVIQEQEFLHHF